MTLAGGASARVGLLLAGHAALMFAVCMLACVAPTRRALRVQPSEAMRTEG
jgi:ABC-type lipoprotein release transport system permease subunit